MSSVKSRFGLVPMSTCSIAEETLVGPWVSCVTSPSYVSAYWYIQWGRKVDNSHTVLYLFGKRNQFMWTRTYLSLNRHNLKRQPKWTFSPDFSESESWLTDPASCPHGQVLDLGVIHWSPYIDIVLPPGALTHLGYIWIYEDLLQEYWNWLSTFEAHN